MEWMINIEADGAANSGTLPPTHYHSLLQHQNINTPSNLSFFLMINKSRLYSNSIKLKFKFEHFDNSDDD